MPTNPEDEPSILAEILELKNQIYELEREMDALQPSERVAAYQDYLRLMQELSDRITRQTEEDTTLMTGTAASDKQN